MIIIGLMGGLGNQLFQYSFARALSKELDEELFIDVTNVNGFKVRHEIYSLNSFNIKGIVGNFPFFETNYLRGFFKVIYHVLKFLPFFKTSPFIDNSLYYLENTLDNIKFFHRQPSIIDFDSTNDIVFNSVDEIVSPSYFRGDFQFNSDSKNRLFITENFFNNYLEIIHEDLMYLTPLSEDSKKIVEDMVNSDSILLHIRRGDYGQFNDVGFCSEEYYKKAIQIIASKVDNPKFFIFSNDMEGAKELLDIDYPHVFVDFKENKELVARGNAELLKLMSSCKHFIIANSTLSWWAAFLGENKDKIIITPEPWFQNRRVMGVETIDNKLPMKVVNNNSEIYNNSENLICKLNEDEFSFEKLKVDKLEASYRISNLSKNSRIILKNKINNSNQMIIKVSLEANCFNCLRIFFKTKDKKRYCDENSFMLFYYEGDDFSQYLIMPNDAILDGLKIVPAYPFENQEDYVIIKTLEIKEIS